MAYILGISGSPIRNSNTDRTVQIVLEATGLETRFVKLSDLTLEPCRACLGCVKSNTCVVQDDAGDLADAFRDCAGFVIGGYTPYSSLDARTKTFMERMYCLRHKQGLNAGKPGVAVITTACNPELPGLPPAAEIAGSQFAIWAMEEGINLLGTIVVTGNVPCIRCGFGDSCAQSGVKMLHGQEATVASVGISQLESQQANVRLAGELGARLREAALGSTREPVAG